MELWHLARPGLQRSPGVAPVACPKIFWTGRLVFSRAGVGFGQCGLCAGPHAARRVRACTCRCAGGERAATSRTRA